jgi:pentatricopeptide repeat protein
MRKRGVDEAWNALEEMQQQGVLTDKYTISRMLMKTVGDGRSRMNPSRVYRGIALVEKFIDVQPKDVDEVLLNALLDTCCRLKDLNRLESTVQRMRDLKITPSPVTLGILVKTYGQAGDIEKVLKVWDEMEKQRGQANAVTYGCMIDACVKCNRLDKAVEIFQGMRETGKHRNTILYTTLIKGYGLEKDLTSALALFREMPEENVPYNTITYNSIIDACVKGGDLPTAEALLHDISSPNSPLEPDLITFSTLLKGYCHGGELDKALQLCEAIKARGLRCDELVYNTLMDGCVKANDVTAGVGLFEEMVHAGMRPSAITHSILARLYQRAGYEDDASEAVAQLYQHHGIERPTGGDRGKGLGRRNGNQRSPLGGSGTSPSASPMSGYGTSNDRGDACWSGWAETGYDGWTNPSNASTPCGSPMHHTGGHNNGLFLPLDAMRGMPPPLPGMNGSETPYSSCGGGTPVNSAYGSFGGSPYMSPIDQHQAQVQLVAASAPSGNGMPSLPPWPFATGTVPSNTMGTPNMMSMSQGIAPGMHNATVPQYCTVPTAQGAPGAGQGDTPHPDSRYLACHMQVPNGAGPGGGSPMSYGVIGQCPPGQTGEAQQSPFPMPLSPPHDLAQNCTPSQPQQAYFEFMPDNGGAQNPFCL